MRTEIGYFFTERAWEKHAMLITVVRLCYGVDFKQVPKSGQ